MSTLVPNMGIEIPGSIRGDRIIDQVLDIIAATLQKDCSLRSIDTYRGFAVRGEIHVQLLDVYTVDCFAGVQIGSIDPALPVQKLTLAGDEVEAQAEAGQSLGENLERPVDQSAIEPATSIHEKRQYVSRVRTAAK